MALNRKSKIDEAEEAAHASAEAGEKAAEFKDPYDVGARPAEGGKPLRQWKRRVRKARKVLRKDLKAKGIRKKQEFEQIAWEMGLTLDDKKRAILWWWRGLLRRFGLGALLAALLALLLMLFLLSYITDHAGAFTINMTANMLKNGFVLCDEPEFNDPTSRLRSDKTKDINNITIGDVRVDVDDVDGAHNGDNYVAYTFYVKNNGETVESYYYALKIGSASLGVNDAVWIMLFEDGHQVMYAKKSADGDPEAVIGYDGEPPFYDLAYNANKQYYEKDGEWGIRTTPFLDEENVVRGYVDSVQPEEIHKYTVVIWLEGNDPECVDGIFGGHATYSMEFSVDDDVDHRNIFSGVWRTEYDEYAEYAAAEMSGAAP